MKKRTRTLLLGTIFCSTVFAAQAQEVSILGPIERLSPDSKAITVLGQSVEFPLNAKRFEVQDTLVAVGTLILVEGERSASGSVLAKSLKSARRLYVPGATDVGLSGVVSSFEKRTGILKIGELEIYVLEASSDAVAQIEVGASVEILGQQSQPRGPIWAKEISLTTRSNDLISNSFLLLTKGIGGTGSEVDGIAGTGAQSQGIAGTGKTGQANAETSFQTQGIAGTGFQSQGIAGTGKTTQGIAGTVVQTEGIAGTGVQSQGIAGTGKATQGIAGTGMQTQGIAGTGLQSQGIAGTGRTAQGIAGTGAR